MESAVNIWSEEQGKYVGLPILKGDDGQDGLTPFINESGNWQIGDVDTGVNAQGVAGENGQDGHAPVITIVDGYWCIDGVNTNVNAVGLKGDNGITPHIGDNGNWFIGDTDTNVPAKGSVDGVAFEVDQEYNSNSENPQSGTAVKQGIDNSVGNIADALALIVEGSSVVPTSILDLLSSKLGDQFLNRYHTQIEEKINDSVNNGIVNLYKSYKSSVKKLEAGSLVLQPNHIYAVVIVGSTVQDTLSTVLDEGTTETTPSEPEVLCTASVYDEVGNNVLITGRMVGAIVGNYGDTSVDKAEAFVGGYKNLTFPRGIYTACSMDSNSNETNGTLSWNTTAIVIEVSPNV